MSYQANRLHMTQGTLEGVTLAVTVGRGLYAERQ